MLLGTAARARSRMPVPAPPQTRVLIVSGAAGSDEYAEQQKKWRETLVAQLATRFAVPASRTVVLAEKAGDGLQAATAVNVRQALAAIRASQGTGRHAAGGAVRPRHVRRRRCEVQPGRARPDLA